MFLIIFKNKLKIQISRLEKKKKKSQGFFKNLNKSPVVHNRRNLGFICELAFIKQMLGSSKHIC